MKSHLSERKPTPPPARNSVVALAAVVSMLLLPASAGAREPQPDDLAAADAYREAVPTAGGPRPVAPGGGRLEALPPSVARTLARDPSPAARTLERLAADPGLGAQARGVADAPADRLGAQNPVFAAVESVEAGASGFRSLALGLAMAVLLCAGLAASFRRPRAD